MIFYSSYRRLFSISVFTLYKPFNNKPDIVKCFKTATIYCTIKAKTNYTDVKFRIFGEKYLKRYKGLFLAIC